MSKTIEQDRFYKRKAWKKCRQIYLSEHPYCERCTTVGKTVPAYHVHHKIWLDSESISNPDIALNPEHLEALCIDCHNREHMSKPQTASGLIFDANGDLVRA